MFGLYSQGDGDTPRSDDEGQEAKDIFRFLDERKSQILLYLSELRSVDGQMNVTGDPYTTMQEEAILASHYQPARDLLIAQFGMGYEIDTVVVHPKDLDGLVEIPNDGSGIDLVFAEEGDDILDGGEGDDVLYGGEGKDTLIGGQNDAVIDQTYHQGDRYVLGLVSGGDVLVGEEGQDTYELPWDWGITYEDANSYMTLGERLAIRPTQGVYTIIDSGKGFIKVNNWEHDGYHDIKGTFTSLGDGFYSGGGWTVRLNGDGDLELLASFGVDQNEEVFNVFAVLKDFQSGDFEIKLDNGAIAGTPGNDTLNGTSEGDTLSGGDGDDVLNGGDGNDLLSGGAGADTINGGNGVNDTVLYDESNAAVTVNLTTNVNEGGHAEGDTLSGVENVIGSAYNDSITGDGADNSLYGEGGNDILVGMGGDDVFDGGAGTNTYIIGLGHGNDIISSFTLDDTIWFSDEISNRELWFTRRGNNLVITNLPTREYTTVSNWYLNDNDGSYHVAYIKTDDHTLDHDDVEALVQAMAGKPLPEDEITDFELLTVLMPLWGDDGYPFALGDNNANVIDKSAESIPYLIFGYGGNDTLTGSSAADYIDGGDGDDTLNGGDGDDILHGGAGEDALNGGNGYDIASYKDATAAVLVNLTTPAQNTGNADGDSYNSIEGVYGSEYGDTLIGNSQSNYIRGFAGNDTINGNNGHDVIEGGAGADTIDGGSGFDTASYEFSNAGVTVDLNLSTAQVSGGDASGDILSNIEDITGSAYDDILTGNSALNYLSGGKGDDILQGNDGEDALDGGEGWDIAVFRGDAATYTVNVYLNGDVEVNDDAPTVDGDDGQDYMWGIEILRFKDQDVGAVPPVILDLNGDGVVETITLKNSQTLFDMDGNGTQELTGWVGPNDAFLALDRNGDGIINDVSEISFINDLKGARSDLEGLLAFDSNGDGVLSALDERFGEFGVWQDKNSDGITDEGEFMGLTEAGISSVDLNATAVEGAWRVGANITVKTGSFTRTDGSSSKLEDTILSYAPNITDAQELPTGLPEDSTPQAIDAANKLFHTLYTHYRDIYAAEDMEMPFSDADSYNVDQFNRSAYMAASQTSSLLPLSSASLIWPQPESTAIASTEEMYGDAQMARMVQAMASFGASAPFERWRPMLTGASDYSYALATSH